MESQRGEKKERVKGRSETKRQVIVLVLGCLTILAGLLLIRPVQWQLDVLSSEDQPIFTENEVSDYVSHHLPDSPEMFWLPYRGSYFEPAYTTAEYLGDSRWLVSVGVKSKLFEKPFGYELSVYFYEQTQAIEIAGIGALRPG